MKALKIFFGIIIFIIVTIFIIIFLALSTPVNLVKYDTNVDLKEQLLTLASSSVGSRVVVPEELLNEVAGGIIAEQVKRIDFEGTPVSFAGMNLYLENGALSVYALLNFESDTFALSWIKELMISGVFELSSDSHDITVVLKKVRLGRLPLPAKTIVSYVDYYEVPDGMDIQNLSYTISYNDLSKMISEDIKISKLGIGNEKLSFYLSFNSEKITEIIDSLTPLIIKSEEIINQIKKNIPSEYSGIVEDGKQVLDILRESIEIQAINMVPDAYISWFEGDVTVQYPDTEELVFVDFGMDIESGSVVKTGADSNVEIVLPDGSLLILQSDTNIVLEEVYFNGKDRMAKTSVFLGVGRVRSILEKMVTNDSFYEIRTPSGVAGVRGTDFGVSYSANDKKIDVIVLSGTVKLKNNEGTELIMEPDTIASIDKKGKLSGIKTLNSKTRTEFIQQIPINTFVYEGNDNKFSTLFPIILRIIQTWDSMSYEEQQEFISIVDNSIELESLLKEFDLEGIQEMIPN